MNVIVDKLAWFDASPLSVFVLLCDCVFLRWADILPRPHTKYLEESFTKQEKVRIWADLVSSVIDIFKVNF